MVLIMTVTDVLQVVCVHCIIGRYELHVFIHVNYTLSLYVYILKYIIAYFAGPLQV